jgi:hypothetical protein
MGAVSKVPSKFTAAQLMVRCDDTSQLDSNGYTYVYATSPVPTG